RPLPECPPDSEGDQEPERGCQQKAHDDAFGGPEFISGVLGRKRIVRRNFDGDRIAEERNQIRADILEAPRSSPVGAA
ncbi:MAG: hypothetical protein J0I66_04365, partial [Microbacterium sp.]|nr:hypothetical protein [Microbacterium sp.]